MNVGAHAGGLGHTCNVEGGVRPGDVLKIFNVGLTVGGWDELD